MNAGHSRFCDHYVQHLCNAAGPSRDCFIPTVGQMLEEFRVGRSRPDKNPVVVVAPIPVATVSITPVFPDTTVDYELDVPENNVPVNTQYSDISD